MSRRKAREIALQALFVLDFNETGITETIDAVFSEYGKISSGTRDYAHKLVSGALASKQEIDNLITKISSEWKIDRMAAVDRNIVRIAIFEMRFSPEKITPNIIINEAVELAKVFGTEDSGRFVNGILGSLLKESPL